MAVVPEDLKKMKEVGKISLSTGTDSCNVAFTGDADGINLFLKSMDRGTHIIFVLECNNQKKSKYAQMLIDKRLVELELKVERKKLCWLLFKVPRILFVNPTQEFFIKDRSSPDYDYKPRSKVFFFLILKREKLF